MHFTIFLRKHIRTNYKWTPDPICFSFEMTIQTAGTQELLLMLCYAWCVYVAVASICVRFL